MEGVSGRSSAADASIGAASEKGPEFLIFVAISNCAKKTTADEIAEMATRGEDISAFFTNKIAIGADRPAAWLFGTRTTTDALKAGNSKMITGVNGQYEWLETDHGLPEFLELCAHAIVGKYVVITSVDSGSFVPSETNRAIGWTGGGGLAYSPRIQSTADMPLNSYGQCAGYDEWYIFDAPPQPLGMLCHDNPFTTELVPGTVSAFVNFLGFGPSELSMEPVTELFWRQMAWVQADSYVGDGHGRLVFATRNRELLASVRDVIETHSAKP